MSAQHKLRTAERHLGWAAESIQEGSHETRDHTARGALATALADLEHVRQRIQRLISYVGGER